MNLSEKDFAHENPLNRAADPREVGGYIRGHLGPRSLPVKELLRCLSSCLELFLPARRRGYIALLPILEGALAAFPGRLAQNRRNRQVGLYPFRGRVFFLVGVIGL